MSQTLNPKQEAFVAEYIIDLNATQAAIRAGYSAKTAYSQGQRLLKNVEVQKAIENKAAQRSVKAGIDAQWVLNEAIDLYKECRVNEDRSQANKALDTIGKHVTIQAWREAKDVSVTITHEDALADLL